MNMKWFGRGAFAALVMVLTLVTAACDSSSADEKEALDQDVSESIAFIAADLEMDASEAAVLESAFVESGDHPAHEPGFLWYVAERLQQKLSDPQKERIFAHMRRHFNLFGRPGFHHGLGAGFDPGFMHRQGFGTFAGFASIGAFADHLGLTDDQKAAIRELVEAFRAEVESLRIAHQDGSITDDEFRASLESLGEAFRTDWENLLTDDQKAILEQMKEDREAARAEREARMEANRAAAREVMIDVLGLTDDQVAALDALHQEIQELREAFQELIDSGATREEVRQWAEGANADVASELADILDQRQLEIFVIHGMLDSRAGMRLQFDHMRRQGPPVMG